MKKCVGNGVTLLCLCALLGACVSYQPVSQQPPLQNEHQWQLSDVEAESMPLTAVDIQKLPAVQRYITQVLDNNLDLKAAAATAQAAAASAAAEAANRSPQVQIGIEHKRSKDPLTLETSTATSLSTNISWVVDLWGKLADESEAARLYERQQSYAYLQIKQVLIAQAMMAWTDYWQLQEIHKGTEALCDVYQNLIEIDIQAYQSGLSSYENYIDSDNTLKQNLSDLQQIIYQKQATLYQINVYRGQHPAKALSTPDIKLSAFVLPLPEHISATRIESRPDIRTAFLQVQILDLQAMAAYKALLPQISLTGGLFKSRATATDAFRDDLLWELIGSITQPVINGGQLKALAKQKSEQAQAALMQYQDTVLKALQEVETAFSREKSLIKRLAYTEQKVTGNARKIESDKERYLQGQLSVDVYLHSRAQYLMAHNEWIALQAEFLKNRIQLALALGIALDKAGDAR